MVDSIMGATELSASGVNYVVAAVQKALIETAKVAGLVMNATSMVGPGALSVAIPRITNFSVQDKSEGTANDYQSVTAAVDQISLNKHKRIVALIEDYAKKQSVIDWDSEMVMRTAQAMALQIDSDIVDALVDGYSSTTPDHYVETDGYDITLEKINNASYLLNNSNVPREGRFIVLNPAQEKALFAIDNVIQAQSFGSAAPIQNGVIASLFGMPIVSTTECPVNTFVVAHPEAVAFAMQGEPTFKTMDNLKQGGTEYALSADYGVKVLNSGKLHVVTKLK